MDMDMVGVLPLRTSSNGLFYAPVSQSTTFVFIFPPVWLLPYTYPPHFPPPPFSSFPSFFTFPFLSLPSCQSPSPLFTFKNMTASILSYAVSHSQEDRRKPRKTCADTVGHLTVPDSEKWPFVQRFNVQATDRRSPIQVLTQRSSAWFGWSPGIANLSYIERCLYVDQDFSKSGSIVDIY